MHRGATAHTAHWPEPGPPGRLAECPRRLAVSRLACSAAASGFVRFALIVRFMNNNHPPALLSGPRAAPVRLFVPHCAGASKLKLGLATP